MDSLLLVLLLLATAAVAAAGASCRRRRRSLPGGRRGFVEVAGPYRSLLRELGLTEPRHFLALEGAVVSGHPGREVLRLTLGAGAEAVDVYLKRERRIPWSVRLENFRAGFGLASRSLREARTLQALQRERLAAPEWLAAGEDGRGGAFLLVRAVAGAVGLRDFLRACLEPDTRRRAARALGRELARLHATGFAHHDLYAQHVLVDPSGEHVWFLDWQRSRRGQRIGWVARERDLATVHATLADELAGPRERLLCLDAYVSRRQGRADKRRPRQVLEWVAAVTARADLLRRHRHVAEKRQPGLPPQRQEWRFIEGAALCVTPGAGEAWLGRTPGWLSLDCQPEPSPGSVSRRWLAAPDGGRALLVRRKGRPTAAALVAWLVGRPSATPEQRLASLLFRLQRYAVAVPRVLAMGERAAFPWYVESFLLTAPDAEAVGLGLWLSRQARLPERRRVLREAGAVLRRLHAAACYLGGAGADALAVRPVSGRPAVVLARPELVNTRRRPSPSRARRDLRTLQRSLATAGAGRSDCCRLRRGYENDPAGRYRTDPDPAASRPANRLTHAGVAAPPRRGGIFYRLFRGVRRLRERPEWVRYAGRDWSDGIMDLAVTDRFAAKQGRTTGRRVFPDPDGAPPLVAYLKRHYVLPWWQRWLASLWPRHYCSPAMREWRHLQWARAQGLPVPEPLAAAEFIGPAGRLRSFLAVRELTGMLPLGEAIPLAAARLGRAAFRRWKAGLAVELARLARLLHDRRCFHKDLYFCHFYVARVDTADVPPGGWRGRVCLIDLHRLAHHPLTWRLWRTKDLAQILYSSDVPEVDVQDRVRFWRAYRGPGPRPPGERWLRRWVLFKWGRYRRHNARRKAREAARLRQAG
jgi:heptose I phosphotransferase